MNGTVNSKIKNSNREINNQIKIVDESQKSRSVDRVPGTTSRVCMRENYTINNSNNKMHCCSELDQQKNAYNRISGESTLDIKLFTIDYEMCSDERLNEKIKEINRSIEVTKKTVGHYSYLADNNNNMKAVYQKVQDDLYKKLGSLDELKDKILFILFNRQINTSKNIIKSSSDALIKEINDRIWREHGCCCRLGEETKFPKELQRALYDSYSEVSMTNTGDMEQCIDNSSGENLIICQQAYKDLHRMEYRLISKNGTNIAFPSEPFPHDSKLQHEWKRTQVGILLAFCEHDKQKLYQLSKCMCQQIANACDSVLFSKQDYCPFCIDDVSYRISNNDAKLERYFELKQEESGCIILKYINKVKEVAYILSTRLKDTGEVNIDPIIATDPNQSYYYLETGIILNPKGVWMPYEGGSVEYRIVKQDTYLLSQSSISAKTPIKNTKN